MNNMLHS